MTKRINTALIFVAVAACMLSCKRDYKTILRFNDLSNTAFVKVYVATVTANRNYVYADNTPLTGAALTLGSIFPANVAYAAVQPGTKNVVIKDTLPGTTQLPINFSGTFQAGKYYTIFTYDTINSPKYKIVEDDIVIPADTTARVRFANFIFTKTPVPNVDVFSKRQNATVFTNVAIEQVTNFIPWPSKINDTLFVRETGTTNLLATLNGFLPDQKRSYTLVFRGRYQNPTAAPARTLTFYTNR